MRTKLTLLLMAIVCVLTVCLRVAPAFAQTTGRNELEEEARKELEREAALREKTPWTQDVGFDYGGWMRVSYYDWEDEPPLFTVPPTLENERYLREVDVRVWAGLELYGVHNLYLRLKDIYYDYSDGDNPDGDPEDRWDGVEIDQAFYSVDLGGLLRDKLRPEKDFEANFTIGRQFMCLGTGLVFNNVVDGFSLTTLYGDICVKLFGAKSNHDEEDVDTSRPGSEHMNRTFWGGQVDYVGMQHHTPYLFFMRQSDHNSERTEVLQDFRYDSYYLGLGIRGELAESLGYYVEHVWEGGKSTAQTDFDFLNQRQEIIAEAWNVGLDYSPICRFQPSFALQYLHGSGDEDKISVTDADRGNLGDTNDYGFMTFGYVFTGYSLEPDVSNINTIRFGASAKFLEEHEAFKDMELGFDYFNYWKDEREGGISDYRAVVRMDQPEQNDIGDELDLRLDWRIFSDLTFTARFGMFWTGDAYEDDVRRDFLVLGLTLSF